MKECVVVGLQFGKLRLQRFEPRQTPAQVLVGADELRQFAGQRVPRLLLTGQLILELLNFTVAHLQLRLKSLEDGRVGAGAQGVVQSQ